MAKSILVVEDHDDVRTMMKIMVELYGYTALVARDGVEAVEQARQHCPDLILMDISMPLMDGLSAARIIKSSENCAQIPIVIVTSYREMSQEAIDAGCAEVIPKPIEFPHLKKVIESYVS